MPNHGLAIPAQTISQALDARVSARTVARRVLQGVGGGAAIAFAAAMPWAEFTRSGVSFGSMSLPVWSLAVTGLIILAGLVLFSASVWGLVSRLPTRTMLGTIVIAVVTLLSIAGLEYGYFRSNGVDAYLYRPAARLCCYMLGIALLACSVPEDLGPKLAIFIRRRQLNIKHVVLLALGATAMGATIGAWFLDGMPHVIDGTAYLLEARTLWSGRLAVDTPMHPDLFASELIAFRLTDAGYFAKYPIGWPLVLGLFDAAGMPWLANAALAGTFVALTFLVVNERGSKRFAVMSAAAVALCPWLWFNAATMLAHLAAAVWLWLFLWLLLRTVRTRSRVTALLAGLALGAAALTRPADAAFFALPCIVAALCWTIRRPSIWLTRLPLVAIGALPGTIAYFWVNAQLSGDVAAGYGSGYAGELAKQAPDSLAHALIWMHESWVGLSTQWFSGAVPGALLLVCGLAFGRSVLRGQWLIFSCSLSLMLCYGVVVFGGKAWVGPRWYVPLIPAGAILIAAGFEAAARAARVRSPAGILAAGHLRASLVAGAVVFMIVIPVRLIELKQWPPHGIDGRLVNLVEQAGVTNAVVALPMDGLDPTTKQPNYKRGIAGMWSMKIPFENSDVIYITAVDGWEQMAAEAWPERHLLVMNDKAGDWVLTETTTRITTPYEPTP